MSDFQFIKGEVFVAGGTLKQFKVKHDEINAVQGQVCKASNLFPCGEHTQDGQMIYEFAIYYTADPNRNKTLGNNGKVEEKVKVEDKATMKNPLTRDDIKI